MICGTCTLPGNECACVAQGAFAKFNAGKIRYSLVDASALRLLVEVLEHGAKKYAPDNWKRVADDWLTVYGDAMMRHYEARRAGEVLDADSGLRHTGHMLCCAMFIAALDLARASS